MSKRVMVVLGVMAAMGWGAVWVEAAERVRVYLGTYTRGESRGIYVCELDTGSGRLSTPRLAVETENPGFLAIAPNGRFLYAVNDVANFEGEKSGAVSAFAIDSGSGALVLLNQQSSRGAVPCHMVIDRTGRSVLIANYTSGTVAALPVGADGRLGPAGSVVQHEGSSVHRRQTGPRAHSINLDPAERFAFAADLGIDKVLVYRFEASGAVLEPHEAGGVAVEPGSGPRHLAFGPSGRFAYVINELSSTVTALSYDAERGVLSEVQTISTLPEGYNEANTTAEVVVHPSGRFLYGSNRGQDAIAIFAIDEASGKLTARGHQATGGRTPRNFAIDPTGRWLLAANQGTHDVQVFAIDGETGALTATGHSIAVHSPVCIRFTAMGER